MRWHAGRSVNATGGAITDLTTDTAVDTLYKWVGGVILLTASPDVCTLCVDTPKGNVHAQGSL